VRRVRGRDHLGHDMHSDLGRALTLSQRIGGVQGAKFSPRGNLWITTGGDPATILYGVDGIDGAVLYDQSTSGGDEAEGLDILDTTTETRPGMTGQLHLMMLDNSVFGDHWSFRHLNADATRLGGGPAYTLFRRPCTRAPNGQPIGAGGMMKSPPMCRTRSGCRMSRSRMRIARARKRRSSVARSWCRRPTSRTSAGSRAGQIRRRRRSRSSRRGCS
jgi:hypothetical protein